MPNSQWFTRSQTHPAVAFRRAWEIILPCLALALCPLAATQGLALRVSTETLPAAGFAQIKLWSASPQLVTGGGFAIDLDPAVFGTITQVAVFSAIGDAQGYANVRGQHADVYFTSPSGGVGQLPGLPVAAIWAPLLAGAAVGTKTTVTVDATADTWTGALGNAYQVNVSPGAVTVGGRLSIASVGPGGGPLPVGTVLHISGTGFDATTTVSIDGVALAMPVLISPQQLDVPLTGAADLEGRRVHLATADGQQVDYFPALPSASGTLPTGLTAPAGIHILLPSATYSIFQVGDNRSSTASNQDSLALLNQSASPVDVTLRQINSTGVPFQQAITIPAGALYFFGADSLVHTSGLPANQLWIQAAAPLRMLEFVYVISGPPPYREYLLTPGVSQYLPQFRMQPDNTPYWTWQAGTAPPAPTTINLPGNLSFTMTTSGQSWFSVTASGGTAPATLTVTPHVAGLATGTYTGSITLMAAVPAGLEAFGVQPYVIPVTLRVTAPQSLPPQISSSQNVDFSVQAYYGDPNPRYLSVTSDGGALPYTVTVTPGTGGNWLTVAPLGGTTPSSILLTPKVGSLTSGTHTTTLTIQGPNNTLSVPVTLSIGPEPGTMLSPSSAALTFVLAPGQTPASGGAVSMNPIGANLTSVTVQPPTAGWLQAAIGGNYPTPASVVVHVSSVGLAPGTHQATVTAASSNYGSAQFLVTLSVTQAGALPVVTPASISLEVPAGTSYGQEPTATLHVDAVGGPALFTFQFSGSFPAVLGAGIGTAYASLDGHYLTPADIVLSFGAASPGLFRGTITIATDGGTVSVPVTLSATAAAAYPPVLTALASGGALTSGAVAPGEIISLFGAGLGGLPANLMLDPSGKVATTLGGTQVLINGVAAPLTYASSGQINAVVPYEAGTSGVAAVQVKSHGAVSAEWGLPLAASAPALFTLGGTGVGQAAALDQDSSINGVGNEAARGTVVVLYATGEGATIPASTTGSVTAGVRIPALPVTVKIGGMDAYVAFAGEAPGDVSGVLQVNAVVPASVTPGPAVPVTLSVGGVASQSGVTVAVR